MFQFRPVYVTPIIQLMPDAHVVRVGADAPSLDRAPMSAWEYVEAHPWWTLIFLMVIAGGLGGALVRITTCSK